MNTSSKMATLLAAAGLLSAAHASAQTTFTWISTSGAWTTPTNWDQNAVPSGTTNTATIDNVSGGAHSQTVTYDVSTGNLTTPLTIGTINLLNSAGAGFTNLLQLTSTAVADASTTTNPTASQGVFVVSNAINLSSAAGTVELRLTPNGPNTAASFLTLQAAGINIGTNGILTLDASSFTSSKPSVRANTTINGGTLNILGSSSVGGIGSGTGQRNTLTMNSGNITFANTNGRLLIYDGFTATGGTITASTTNTIELYGTTNSISGVTYVNPAALTYSFRNNAAQSLSSTVDLPNLLFRNGQVNTISTSAGVNIATISIATTASTLRLGSNLSTPSLPSVTITGSTIDLNGFTLTSSATGAAATTSTFTPTGVTTLSSTSGTTGTLSVNAFSFGTNASVVGPNVTLLITGSPSTTNTNSTGGLTSTVGATGASYDATSTIQFTGTSNATAGTRLILAAGTGGNSIGNLIVGSGTSSTFVQLGNNPFTFKGDVTIQSGGILDINARTQTVNGKLQGTGTLTQTNPGGLLTFASTGGLSPGGTGGAITGSGNVGTLSMAGSAPLTLIGTSVSIFDLASDTSFDRLAATTTNTITAAGTLNVNLANGYSPAVGTTWNIVTGANTASAGTFSAITSNVSGDTFTFGFLNGIGTLTLTASTVPEPSTWAMVAIAACAVMPMRRALRKNRQA